MSCNNTCPLCRLEAIVTRLEHVLAALPCPFADTGVAPFMPDDERVALEAAERALHDDYQQRIDAWNLRKAAEARE